MKTLLWKEYRQNLRFFVAAGIFLVFPYVFVVMIRVVEIAWYAPVEGGSWVEYFHGANIASLCIGVLLCAFIAGNAVAGERADRSAEFVAYLPISRGAAIACKAILAIGVSVLIWMVNSLIFFVSSPAKGYEDDPNGWIVLGFAVSAIIVFGVSWLISTLVTSPTTAAACGVVAFVVVLMTMAIIVDRPGLNIKSLKHWFGLASLVLGVGCFVAGTMYYLRRVEP